MTASLVWSRIGVRDQLPGERAIAETPARNEEFMATLRPKVEKARVGLLRRLSELDLPKGKVLSFYVDLDPSEFATASARDSEVHSLTNEAEANLSDARMQPLRVYRFLAAEPDAG